MKVIVLEAVALKVVVVVVVVVDAGVRRWNKTWNIYPLCQQRQLVQGMTRTFGATKMIPPQEIQKDYDLYTFDILPQSGKVSATDR
ncbi:hypothetical protein K470DRAFT_84189 [Piedraia hortae CBS 480.64]|uniref:Uncharacterized protein n=1 Tax=Piedraia hortae CBS 480.64 TaxID=1314780 RepID=A0A6A7C9G6_9PEZI|nr:hypothetical protein K470DRAFT_84189 [Piedraia hortae CBS 480.64]